MEQPTQQPRPSMADEQERFRGDIEELLAEKKRGEYVRDVLGGAAEQTFGEMEELDKLARTDSLTKISNRRGFLEDVGKLTSLVSSGQNRRQERNLQDIAILLVDVDDFKEINDLYGHDVGDQVFRAIVSRFQQKLRGSDLISRWGGDEFVMAFPGATTAEIEKKFHFDSGEHQASAKISMEVSVSTPKGAVTLVVTFSGGISGYRPMENIEDTIKRADVALLMAKRKGKNQLLQYREDVPKEDSA